MHPGITMDRLGDLIVKQKAEKRDFIAPTSKLELVAAGREKPALGFSLGSESIVADLTPLALGQIASWSDIPTKYADRLASNPENFDLLERNVNHWFAKHNKERLIRSFMADSGTALVRAFLSNRYRCMDNYDLAACILPILKKRNMQVKSCQLTESRLYIQAIDERLMAKIEPGVHQRVKDDVLYGGIVISNSEVGCGTLSIEGLLYRLACTNGMIVGDGFRRYHLGGASRSGDKNDPFEVFSDATKQLSDQALWAQVSDVVTHVLSEAAFQAVVAKFQAATTIELPMDPKHVIEVTAQKFGLSNEEQDAAFKALFAEGDMTLYGLTNAITNIANSGEMSYDRAVQIERIGSDILTVDPKIFHKN